jgi:hypothetical protein
VNKILQQPMFFIIGGAFAVFGVVFAVLGFLISGDPSWNRTGRVIFIGMGSLFAIIGIGFLVFLLQARMKQNRLLRSGNVVYADLTGVKIDRSVSINGRHPWTVTCEWTDPETNFVHTFTGTTTTRPDRDGEAPVQFPVHLDPDDPSKYYIDLDKRRELR